MTLVLKFVLSSAAAFLLLIIASVDSCADGWSSFQESCYLFADVHLNFHEAESYCKQRNSGLIRVDNKLENDFIKQEMTKQSEKYWWLGLTDEAKEGTWKWIDSNDTAAFFDWSQHEPDSWGNEDCVIFNRQSGWADTSCTERFPPLCEKRSDVHITSTLTPPVDSCADGWLSFQGSCYLLGDGHMNFHDAQYYCRQHKSNPIHVDNKVENDYIKQELAKQSDTYWWLGMTDKAKEGEWRWVDNGEIVTFSDWINDEPNSLFGNEDCAVYAHSYGWFDTSCTDAFRPICEKSRGVPQVIG